MKRNLKLLPLLPVLLLPGMQPSVMACATCYGASDSPLAQGMNWGILTLLCVIGTVLAAVAAFFVHVGIKSSQLNNPDHSSSHKNP